MRAKPGDKDFPEDPERRYAEEPNPRRSGGSREVTMFSRRKAHREATSLTIRIMATLYTRNRMIYLVACYLLLASIASVAHGYSIHRPYEAAKKLSQKSIIDQTLRMATTQRETIRMMPNQTPMVPYKVRACDCTRCFVVKASCVLLGCGLAWSCRLCLEDS